MNYQLVYSKQAEKDAKKLSAAGLKSKAMNLIEVLEKNPFQAPPAYEKLIGNLTGLYSRRINIQHRLIYQVLEQERIVKILRLWSHYE